MKNLRQMCALVQTATPQLAQDEIIKTNPRVV